MENEEQRQRARPIVQSLEEGAQGVFDDEDISNLHTLVYLTINFRDYLTQHPPWPEHPDDPFWDMSYVTESILIHVDSFRRTVHSYHILEGSTGSTISWRDLNIGSLKATFLSLYNAFEKENGFETKCRLLLDLVKLQIVFAGAYFDCAP
jgi:hypothetical protein